MDRGLEPCTGAGDQNHPKEKEMPEGKVAAWGGLTHCREKRSERQRKKEKDIPKWIHRKAKGDKKAFLRERCKEIEKNNTMGETGDVFKKIRDNKGISI